MSNLVVVNDPKDWPLRVPGVEVVSSKSYLTDEKYSGMRGTRVFNLCRSYRYQNNGYYVSLLATARGHKPLPSVTTIQDMKSGTIIRASAEDLDELIQKNFAPLQSKEFDLSIYFGQNLAQRYARLARNLFNLFPVPLLRAKFSKNSRWELTSIKPISMNDVPRSHREFVLEAATEHFKKRHSQQSRGRGSRFDLAILYDANSDSSPSDEKAIRKFVKAAERIGFGVSLLTREDYGELAEYDALFIRDTTYVNHYTYRFAARAAAEGMIVIDDPESIVRCTNKVYTAEVLERHRIATPKTLVVQRENMDQIVDHLGLPCVLKKPDSAFSLGVKKVTTEEELQDETSKLFADSDLIIAQEFLPSDFDWRVGVLNGQALYACRYHMAHNHWQIVRHEPGKSDQYGKVDTIPIGEAPRAVVQTAVKAAKHFGDGLYGVDLKQFGRRVCVMEVNDNPNIDSGVEDQILGDHLYDLIMRTIMERVEHRGANH